MKRSQFMERLRTTTAYHEAGHAVAYLVAGPDREGARFETIEVFGPDGAAVRASDGSGCFNGIVRGTRWPSWTEVSPDLLRRRILQIMAGPYAQLMFCDAKFQPPASDRAVKAQIKRACGDEGGGDDATDIARLRKDFDTIRDLKRMLSQGGLKLPVSSTPWVDAAQETVTLLREHWPSVDALAKALLARSVVTYDEAVAVMGKAKAA